MHLLKVLYKAASKVAGMDAHVAKPIKTDELFGVMAYFL